MYSSERRKPCTPRMAWGWVNHGVIFIYGWTVPLKVIICILHSPNHIKCFLRWKWGVRLPRTADSQGMVWRWWRPGGWWRMSQQLFCVGHAASELLWAHLLLHCLLRERQLIAERLGAPQDRREGQPQFTAPHGHSGDPGTSGLHSCGVGP